MSSIPHTEAELAAVRNIVFDLGGVVIDLARDQAVEALQAHGMTDADRVLGLYRQEEPFNRFLVGIPVERLRRLRELREAGIKIFALSNTNPIMYNSWIAEHFRQEGLSINDYFDGIVTSFQELCCKPDLRIFRIVLNRYGLKGEETLMLDDSAANCEAARRAGMLALRVGPTPDDDMIALTQRYLSGNDDPTIKF